MVAASLNAPGPLVPEPTRVKVSCATSDHDCNASSLTAIWVALNCEKPVVPSGMVAGAVAQKA